MLWMLVLWACTTGEPAECPDADDGAAVPDGGVAESDSGASTDTAGDGGEEDGRDHDAFDYACGTQDPAALPDCAAAEVWPEGDGPEGNGIYREVCEKRVVWPEACCNLPDELSEDGLLFAGERTLPDGFDSPTFTITDASSWAAFQESAGFSDLPSVDFESQLVVGAYVLETGTCGMWLDRHGVVLYGEDYAARVRLRVIDTSGQTDPCSAVEGVLALYAVDRVRGYPVVCASEVEGIPE